jgi:SAM-dependent methyltransferase
MDPETQKISSHLKRASKARYCQDPGMLKECPRPCDTFLPELTGTQDVLKAIPQPMHIYEYLTRSKHYHFGCFKNPEEGLPSALNRLILRSLDHLVSGGTVLDVGCGLGGTATLLADRGFPTFGIDPCHRAVGFANLNHDGRKNPAFFILSFQDLITACRKENLCFDNIIMTEVMQFIPALDKVFEDILSLISPAGVVVINDVVTVPELNWTEVPFHRQGKLGSAGADAGLSIVECKVITGEVAPTLDQLIKMLSESRTSTQSFFEDVRPCVDDEITELLHQWEQLRKGFANGDLAYETVILRRPEHAH